MKLHDNNIKYAQMYSLSSYKNYFYVNFLFMIPQILSQFITRRTPPNSLINALVSLPDQSCYHRRYSIHCCRNFSLERLACSSLFFSISGAVQKVAKTKYTPNCTNLRLTVCIFSPFRDLHCESIKNKTTNYLPITTPNIN